MLRDLEDKSQSRAESIVRSDLKQLINPLFYLGTHSLRPDLQNIWFSCDLGWTEVVEYY